jgi:hypothetical protein
MDNYTFQYQDTGIILNTDPPTPWGGLGSTFVDVTNVQGLSNAPYRVTERDREGQDGGYVDAEHELMRVIVLEATVYAPQDLLESFLENLKSNFAPGKKARPFYFKAPGVSARVVFCKSYGIKYDWSTARRVGTMPIQIQLVAEDPTIYDASTVSGITALPLQTTGRAYNKSYNYGYSVGIVEAPDDGSIITGDLLVDAMVDSFADTSTSPVGVPGHQANGTITIINSGNKDTGATIRIYGPIVNPAVVHDLSGRALSFQLTVASDEYLEIDLRRRSVLLNGGTSRRYALVSGSRWFLLAPGTNSLRLLGTDPIAGTPDPSMTVEARAAYR